MKVCHQSRLSHLIDNCIKFLCLCFHLIIALGSVDNTFITIDSSCMTNIKILPHKMADFVCIHWVNCISEYSKVKLERNYVQLFYCQPLTSLRTTHLIR